MMFTILTWLGISVGSLADQSAHQPLYKLRVGAQGTGEDKAC